MNKRTRLLLACFTFYCLALVAITGDLPEPGNGYFGGEMSVYVKGDTLMYVYLNTDDSDTSSEYYAKLCISTNAGANWQEYTLPQAVERITKPTIFMDHDDIIVTLDKYLYMTSDFGQSWTLIVDSPPTWDLAPMFYLRGNELSLYELNLPCPQWEQDAFLIEESSNDILKPYSVYIEDDVSMNQTTVYWQGTNDIEGVFRANSDIRIRQTGGGDNQGWPLFHDNVLLGGKVRPVTSTYPVDQVFLAELLESEYREESLSQNPARQFGTQIGNDDEDIYLIEVDGSSYSCWKGVLTEPREVVTPVYSQYPSEASQFLYNNVYTVRDTIWTPITGGPCTDRTFFVKGELWIKGTFSGKQTWTASGDIKLLGDILLSGTPAGDDPASNPSDWVNFLSERNIEFKYGYKNPANKERVHCFVGAIGDPHYVYANLYAIGNGSREGIITFEYQHPHPSTPAVELVVDGETQLFENIDLHRYTYPPTAANPWPSHIDYPWYNPLWPEQHPYLARGEIVFFGNSYQRNRGYFFRNHNDSDYPSNSGVWDVEVDMCGGPTHSVPFYDLWIPDLTIQSLNYPGAEGTGVGYYVTRHNDLRMQFYEDPESWYHRYWMHGIRISSINGNYWDIKLPFNTAARSKNFASQDGVFAYGVNDILHYDSEGYIRNLSSITQGNGTILGLQIDQYYNPWVHQYQQLEDGSVQTSIKQINPNLDHPEVLSNFTTSGNYAAMQDFCVVGNSQVYFTKYQDAQIKIYRIQNDALADTGWSIDFAESNMANSRIYLCPSGRDKLYLFVWESSSPDSWGTISEYNFQLPVSNADPTAPALNPASITAYPNPAIRNLNIQLKLPAHQNHEVEIFNLRGQKVHSFISSGSKNAGEFNIEWNLKDYKNQTVSKGIYFIRVKIDGKATLSKRISII